MRLPRFNNLLRLLPRLLTSLPRPADSICPFCFVGKRRIDEAIRRVKAEGLPLDFSMRFAPFLLDPTLPNSPGVRPIPFTLA